MIERDHMVQITVLDGHSTPRVTTGAITQPHPRRQRGPGPITQGLLGIIPGPDGRVNALQAGPVAGGQHLQQRRHRGLPGAGELHPRPLNATGTADDSDLGPHRHRHPHNTSPTSRGGGVVCGGVRVGRIVGRGVGVGVGLRGSSRVGGVRVGGIVCGGIPVGSGGSAASLAGGGVSVGGAVGGGAGAGLPVGVGVGSVGISRGGACISVGAGLPGSACVGISGSGVGGGGGVAAGQ